MSVAPRGKGWEVQVVRGSQRYRVQVTSEAQGKAVEKAIIEAHSAGKVVDLEALKATASHGRKTLEDAFNVVWRLRWEGTKSADAFLHNWKLIKGEIGPLKALDEVDADTIDRLVEAFLAKGNSWATVNRKLSTLRMILATAEERGWISKAPKLPHRKEGVGRIRYFTHEEISAIHDRTALIGRPQEARLWLFLADTGARVSEALKLSWGDVSRSQVTFWDTKNGSHRSVVLTERAKGILATAKSSKEPSPFALTYEQARGTWDRVKVLLGQEDDEQWVIHTLRHTCASRLVQKGVSIPVIQQWLGHKSIAQTMKYAHLAPNSLDSAAAALNAPD